jgi:RNA polymerase sigma-70 factor (ECF subfamily)
MVHSDQRHNGRESTVESQLILRVQRGDRRAIEQLFTLELPRLRRWARGRVPRRAQHRGTADDLIQEVLIKALRGLRQFSPETGASFQAYLRRALVNMVRDELRAVARSPLVVPLDELQRSYAPSQLDRAIGRQAYARYRAALQRLTPRARQAAVARLERGASYQDVAKRIGCPNALAARAVVGRAVERIIVLMASAAGGTRRTRTKRAS